MDKGSMKKPRRSPNAIQSVFCTRLNQPGDGDDGDDADDEEDDEDGVSMSSFKSSSKPPWGLSEKFGSAPPRLSRLLSPRGSGSSGFRLYAVWPVTTAAAKVKSRNVAVSESSAM